LYFSKENLNELNKAGRFGREPVAQQFAVIPK